MSRISFPSQKNLPFFFSSFFSDIVLNFTHI